MSFSKFCLFSTALNDWKRMCKPNISVTISVEFSVEKWFCFKRYLCFVVTYLFKFNFQGAEKQYYVSKKCATQNYCDSQIRGNMPLCHYLWYEDWKCAECCQGDRCNYYVTVSLLLTLQKFFYILLTYLLLCIFNCK